MVARASHRCPDRRYTENERKAACRARARSDWSRQRNIVLTLTRQTLGTGLRLGSTLEAARITRSWCSSQRPSSGPPWSVSCPGHAPHGDVAVYYASHAVDAFINVSASEGLPVSIMETQSFGTPVIPTSVGGTPELVTQQNGWLLPCDSWRALAHAQDNYPRFACELERMMEQYVAR